MTTPRGENADIPRFARPYCGPDTHWRGEHVSDGRALTLLRGVRVPLDEFDPTRAGGYNHDLFTSEHLAIAQQYMGRQGSTVKLRVPRFEVFAASNLAPEQAGHPVLRHDRLPDLTPFIEAVRDATDSGWRAFDPDDIRQD
ncbi:MAG: hypothetical protein ACT4TC_23385 [Myxococcaceae bacterium]